jgi:hypothetical protein
MQYFDFHQAKMDFPTQPHPSGTRIIPADTKVERALTIRPRNIEPDQNGKSEQQFVSEKSDVDAKRSFLSLVVDAPNCQDQQFNERCKCRALKNIVYLEINSSCRGWAQSTPTGDR